mmetsp:Transcript_39398/g.47789  ORF Transcript_39398/g.47789 Transcript_39398/m.47789 type:complete len:629 (-) Transcript_39398:465-2351(-)
MAQLETEMAAIGGVGPGNFTGVSPRGPGMPEMPGSRKSSVDDGDGKGRRDSDKRLSTDSGLVETITLENGMTSGGKYAYPPPLDTKSFHTESPTTHERAQAMGWSDSPSSRICLVPGLEERSEHIAGIYAEEEPNDYPIYEVDNSACSCDHFCFCCPRWIMSNVRFEATWENVRIFHMCTACVALVFYNVAMWTPYWVRSTQTPITGAWEVIFRQGLFYECNNFQEWTCRLNNCTSQMLECQSYGVNVLQHDSGWRLFCTLACVSALVSGVAGAVLTVKASYPLRWTPGALMHQGISTYCHVAACVLSILTVILYTSFSMEYKYFSKNQGDENLTVAFINIGMMITAAILSLITATISRITTGIFKTEVMKMYAYALSADEDGTIHQAVKMTIEMQKTDLFTDEDEDDEVGEDATANGAVTGQTATGGKLDEELGPPPVDEMTRKGLSRNSSANSPVSSPTEGDKLMWDADNAISSNPMVKPSPAIARLSEEVKLTAVKWGNLDEDLVYEGGRKKSKRLSKLRKSQIKEEQSRTIEDPVEELTTPVEFTASPSTSFNNKTSKKKKPPAPDEVKSAWFLEQQRRMSDPDYNPDGNQNDEPVNNPMTSSGLMPPVVSNPLIIGGKVQVDG